MSSRRGFTLVDTLLAIVLLEVALLGLARALTSAERLLSRGRAATRAAAQGRELLARMGRVDSVCAAGTGARALAGARVIWDVGASPSLRRVTVVVEPAGRASPESLATVVRCA